jgi:hypothetical protein
MISNPYSTIGPFKGVSADILSRSALHANSAHDASTAALARHAAAVRDDATYGSVIRQSVAAANSVWSAVAADAASSLQSAKSDHRISVFPVAIFAGLGAFLMGIGAVREKVAVAAFGFQMVVVAAVAAWVLYLVLGRTAKNAIREIREQGYFDDALPRALARVAGYCMLPGRKALHIASTNSLGKPMVKTVYWDAIGHALGEIDDSGLDRVDIYGRDGDVLASITGPTGTDTYIDARALVDLVSKRVEAARKAV